MDKKYTLLALLFLALCVTLFIFTFDNEPEQTAFEPAAAPRFLPESQRPKVHIPKECTLDLKDPLLDVPALTKRQHNRLIRAEKNIAKLSVADALKVLPDTMTEISSDNLLDIDEIISIARKQGYFFPSPYDEPFSYREGKLVLELYSQFVPATPDSKNYYVFCGAYFDMETGEIVGKTFQNEALFEN